MLDNIFSSLFNSSTATKISIIDFLLCVSVSLVAGAVLACVYTYKNKYTKSFVVTLALLPAVVCVIIMMVNGNIGAGVAVAGAFSLVRFRSVPGTAREIYAIFLAMAVGLVTGMGYLGIGFLSTLLLGLVNLLYNKTAFGEMKTSGNDKILRITIFEDLDYTDVFDELFMQYTTRHEIVNVKTTNMGSLYRLTYNLTLNDCKKEKEFIDKLRCRNGNLEISSSKQETEAYEL
ncbi:MAG: DUF4956 domain-containing protein [Eubacteriales bacterium]